MNKITTATIISALIILALIFGCTTPTPPVGLLGFSQLDDSKATPQGVAELTNANNQFAIDYYNKIDSSGNPDYAAGYFFSPFSISTALAMTYEGAAGKTAEEMQKVFYWPADDTTRQSSFAKIYNQFNANAAAGNYTLNIANSLWPEKTYAFDENYLSTIQKYYYGSINPQDFLNNAETSRQTINTWVEGRTNNKIKDLLPGGSVDDATKMVLVNAIYFKGDWESKFKTDDTKDAPFYTSATTQTNVKMMNQMEEFNYFEDENFQYLSMPYKGEKLSMLVILPKCQEERQTEDRRCYQYSFSIPSNDKINIALAGMYKSHELPVYMPKFKFETEFSMADDLKEMGMAEPFSDGADFSKMDPSKGIKISQIIHKAFVAVDEEGTEAAAATAVVMTANAVRNPTVFNANHPFAFAIIDNDTKMILFMGKVSDPSKLTAEE